MHKLLLRASHACLSQPIENHISKSIKTLSPISHFHDRSERLDSDELRPPPKLAANGFDAVSESGEARQFQICHPWPEWIDLMECLLNRGYFCADENPLRNRDLGRKEASLIRTACLNFSRDRFDLIKFLSRKHIRVIAACGCPSLDRKVVNSGKRLRAHVGIDEGDTCSSCNLRGNCDRAYVNARQEEGGRTVDVMRFLLTYGLDHIAGKVENKLCFSKAVTESARILLKEIVEHSRRTVESNLPKSRAFEKVATVEDPLNLQEKGHANSSMKEGDWFCPKCNFLNFAKKIRCLRCDGFNEEKLKQLREDQKHLPLKKGDWICDKCYFLNFARNTRCMLCKENPPKRQINPGEWECPSCNYINFRRNMLCLKCDYRRQKPANSSDTKSQNTHTNSSYQENRRSMVDGCDFGDVNTQTYAQQQIQKRNSYMQKYVESEREEKSFHNSTDKASDFVDFPIAGGKSDLSQNAEKIESWKLEMLDRSKGIVKVIKDENFQSPRIPPRLDFPNFSDDEDVAEWFGPKQIARASE